MLILVTAYNFSYQEKNILYIEWMQPFRFEFHHLNETNNMKKYEKDHFTSQYCCLDFKCMQ